MSRRVPALLLSLPLSTGAAAALAQDTTAPPAVQQVEVKGPGAQAQRRDDGVGRIVVGREELARYGDTTLSGALKRQPGVSVAGGEIRLRGLGAGYTQILLDGEPAPAGFAIDTLAPDLVERVEILRSASADTGTQSPAGSINVVLRKAGAGSGARPRLKLGVEQAQARTSPNAALQWSGRLGAGAVGVNASLAQTRTREEPLIDERSEVAGIPLAGRRFAERDDTRLTRLSVAPRLDAKLDGGDTLALQGLFDLARNSFGGRQLETTLLGAPTASPDARWRGVYDTWLAKADLSWAHRFGIGRLALKAGVEASRRPGDYLFRGIDGAGIPWFERAVTSGASERRTSSSGKVVAPLWDGHDIALGWEGALTQRSEHRLQRDSLASGAAAVDAPYAVLDQAYDARIGRLALYAQDEWTPRPGLQAYLGLRWEGLDTRTGAGDFGAVASTSSVFSPIGQLVWKLPGHPRDQLRLALARTYKAPQPRQLVPRRYTVNNDNNPANPDFEGNPTLRPELAWGLDAALESYFGRDGVASVSLYARRIRDVVLQRLWRDAGGAWVATPANGGGASVRGIEFDARLPLPAPATASIPGWPALDLRANLGRNWSHVDALPGPDNRLAAQAPFTLNLGADARFGAGAAGMAAPTAGVNLHVVGANTARVTPALTAVEGALRELEAYAAWPAHGGQWRVTLPDLLRRTRRGGQLYADGTVLEQRLVATPRRAALRVQFEAAL